MTLLLRCPPAPSFGLAQAHPWRPIEHAPWLAFLVVYQRGHRTRQADERLKSDDAQPPIDDCSLDPA
jgi:hypothetical protein